MHPNSLYLDRRLFPKVDKLSVLTAAQFMGSRLRSGPGPHTIRADMTQAAFDGTSLLGANNTYLIGAVVSPRPGTTLLRQLLGENQKVFEYVILDPLEPNVVTFTGPRRLPRPLPETHQLVHLDDIIPKFPELSQVNRALVGLLKYSMLVDPKDIPGGRVDLGNGWGVHVTMPWSPIFVITENAKPEDVEVADDPLTERAYNEEMGAKESREDDDEGVADASFSLPG